MSASVEPVVQEMLDYLNESWTAFHAVAAARRMLLANDFVELSEIDCWELMPTGKYFFTRNMSTLVAFAVGGAAQPGAGFTCIGAHTDSPCPKLKPVSKLTKGGFLQLSVAGYGGGLWHTWYDRDLSVAGRVILRETNSASKPPGSLLQRLVKIERPILRIPTLAIHLSREGGTAQGFKFNLQSQFPPVLATAAREALERPRAADGGARGTAGAGHANGGARHHSLLLELLAEELGCSTDSIEDFELQLCDTQPAAVGGAFDEFVFSGRLDNLASCFCATKALIASLEGGSLESEPNVRMLCLFDNEEVGSTSIMGAGGPVMIDTMKRVTQAIVRASGGSRRGNGKGGEDAELHVQAMAKSFLVSADMAHALHPNYQEKHDPGLQPQLGAGMVIKSNVEQRYATNAASAFFFRAAAAAAASGDGGALPVQEFAVAADCSCGSTIGPILAAATGIRTVDVGAAQLSMHSIREQMSAKDVSHALRHFQAVYQHFPSLDAQLEGDASAFMTGVSAIPTCGVVSGSGGGADLAGRGLLRPRPVARSFF